MPSIKEHTKKILAFTDLKASLKLKQLAEHPYDLTKEGNLTAARLSRFMGESAGYRMIYGTERIDDNVMKALFELAQEAGALEKMNSLQSGATMNFIEGYPSENRPALHTALRDFFDQPNPAENAKAAAHKAKQETEKLKAFMARIDKEGKFKNLVAIAIGGSDLGPKANYLANEHLQKKDRTIHFISNLDPDATAMVLKNLNLKNTLVLIVSKSGTTLETATNEAFVRKYFEKAGLKPEEHFIAITTPGTPMDNKKNYLECFYMWDWVGGRFSSSSMGGGVMMAFAFGFDIYWEFLRGANAMDKAALNPELSKNLPLLGALISIWNHNFLDYPTTVIIPYSQALSRYAAHIQQVEMESNGKRIDQQGNEVDFKTGSIIWGEPGTSAQHSFFQLLHQGTEIAPIEFIGYRQNQCAQDIEYKGTTSQEKLLANLFAQSIALATGQKSENPNTVFPGNRPSHILLAKQLTPYSTGALLAYYEHKVAFQGFIWGINSFDQEGVQLGKVLANKLLISFLAQKGKSNESYPIGDVYLKQLETL